MIDPEAARPPAEASKQWDWLPLFFLVVPGFFVRLPDQGRWTRSRDDERRVKEPEA